MKSLMWLGVLFISISWLFFIPIFSLPEPLFGYLILIIGILFNVISFWKNKYEEFDKRFLLVLIPITITIFLVNYPYNIGLLVIFTGVIIHGSSFLFKHKKIQTFSISISLSGLILIVQTLTLPLYSIFISHGHRADFLSPTVSFFGNLFGLNSSVNRGIVFIQTIQQTYPFTTTWEKLGLFSWLNIFIGALVILFLFFRKRKFFQKIAIFLIISFLYLIIRYIAYIHLYINTTELAIFWNPWYMLLSFIPFSLLLIKFIPIDFVKIDFECFKKFNIDTKKLFALFLIFIFVFSIVGVFTFQDPGTLKSGRILIDEYHSDWEDSTQPLDKQWYGMLSTYNYYSLVEWLGYYYTVNRNNGSITSSILDNYDILILKCPTNSYSDQEIWAIVQFVEKGGGLYLIGDHTDVFGMNTYLNQVSEIFGIRFKTDATYELGTGMLSDYIPDKMFAHPIIQNVDKLEFMTSCTLKAPINSENVIIGNRLLSEPGTYSTENFFRESTASPESEYGYLLQVAAIKYGKGRVVAFTDSTVFSSFSFFSDGYQLFTLGTIEYLNRVNEYQYLNIVFFVIVILSLVVILYLLKNETKLKVLYLFLIIGLFSFCISIVFFNNLNKINYPIYENHTEFTQICFEQEHSDFNISLQPSLGLFYDERNYGTFFVWTQRVGCVPSIEQTLIDALSKGKVVVFINPIKTFDSEEINLINDYLYDGGKILLMDSVRNTESTANDLLGNFGLWIQINTNYKRLYFNDNSTIGNISMGNITAPFLSITGGEQVLIGENNESFVNVVDFKNISSGKNGRLVVLIDSFSFSDSIMGGTFSEPDEKQLNIYNTEFYIFEKLLLNRT